MTLQTFAEPPAEAGCWRRRWARQAAPPPPPGCSLTGARPSCSGRNPDSCPRRTRCTGLGSVSFLTCSPNYTQAGSHTPNKGLCILEFHRMNLRGFHCGQNKTRETTEVSLPAPGFSFGEGRAWEGNGTQGPSSSPPLSSQATRGLYRAGGP